MVSSYHIADLLTVLLLLVSPYVMAVPTYPLTEQICEEVSCGKGSCKVDIGTPIGFTCECLSGWKQLSDLTFLPCLIPDCNINSACQKASPPVPKIEIPDNASLITPCYFTYCGGGECSNINEDTYSCECNPGYYNLLNTSTFPCYSDCAFGSNCKALGMMNKGQGNSIFPGKLQWMAISIFALVMNRLWN